MSRGVSGTTLVIRPFYLNSRSVGEPISFLSMQQTSMFLHRGYSYVTRMIHAKKFILSSGREGKRKQWFVVERVGSDSYDYIALAKEFLAQEDGEKIVKEVSRRPHKLILRKIDVFKFYIDEPLYFDTIKEAAKYLRRSSGYASSKLREGKMILSDPGSGMYRKWYVVEKMGEQTVDYMKVTQKFLREQFGYRDKVHVITKTQLATKKQKYYQQHMLKGRKKQERIGHLLRKIDVKYGDLLNAPITDEDFKELQALLGVR